MADRKVLKGKSVKSSDIRISRQQAINHIEKRIKFLKELEKRDDLTGNRPYVAIKYELGVLQSELARAKAGKEPLYKYQSYSWKT